MVIDPPPCSQFDRGVPQALERSPRGEDVRWRFALESAGLGVWDADLVSGRCFYSSTWKRMLGFAEHEVGDDGDFWLTLVHPDDRSRAIESGDQHVNGRAPLIETEFRLRHKDGRWIWVLDRGRVMERDAAGNPTRMIGVQTDITRQKEAEGQLRLLNERIELTLDTSGVGLWHYEPGTETAHWDGRMHEIFGIGAGAGTVSPDTWHARVHPEDAARAHDQTTATLEGGPPMMISYRICRPDGEVRHVHERARLVAGVDRSPLLVGCVWDISEQVRGAAVLADERERLRITLESIGDAVVCTDVEDRITYANPAAENLLGYAEGEMAGRPLAVVFAPSDEESGAPLASATRQAVAGRRTVDRDQYGLLLRPDGGRRSVRDLASPVVSAGGDVVGAVLVMQDVTNARALQREMAFAARHDPLTGLLNRKAFEDNLAAAVAEAAAGQVRHALLYIDLDRFKIINDTAGHAAGDILLKAVAGVLRAAVPPAATVGRIGGDEFAVLLRSCDLDRAAAVGRQLVERVAAERLQLGGRVYDVGASVGIAAVEGPHATLAAAMACADSACYAAKTGGRNRVSVYAADAPAAGRNLSDIRAAAGLTEALAENRFRLFAQEIRDLGAIDAPARHIEILTRIEARDGTTIPAGAFIPAAERFGLMGSVDRWVIRAALEEHGAAIRAVPGLTVAINLSANSLSDPELWPFVDALLARTGFPPRRLSFEITETAAVNNYAAAELFITAARGAGCRIVLDDFGAGLSSFAYLKRFAIDGIKIDGAFVENVARNRFDRAVVRVVGELARELGVEVIAERIEDAEGVATLRELGIHRGQGYLFHRPQPLGELLAGRMANTTGESRTRRPRSLASVRGASRT